MILFSTDLYLKIARFMFKNLWISNFKGTFFFSWSFVLSGALKVIFMNLRNIFGDIIIQKKENK